MVFYETSLLIREYFHTNKETPKSMITFCRAKEYPVQMSDFTLLRRFVPEMMTSFIILTRKDKIRLGTFSKSISLERKT